MEKLDILNSLFEDLEERIETVTVGDIEYYIKLMSVAEFAEILELANVAESQKGYSSQQKARARTNMIAHCLVYSLVDSEGKRIFTADDVEKIQQSANTQKACELVEAIMKLHSSKKNII